MNNFDKVFRVYLYKLIIVVVSLSIVILLIYYFMGSPNLRILPLLAGLSTGLLVALLQLLLAWNEHREMEKIQELGIKKILPYRDEEELYRKAIQGSKKEILVLGNTAFRFMNDFANEDTTRTDKRVLIDALNRKVKVKFLLPKPDFLYNENDKSRAVVSLRLMRELRAQHGNLIECKRFSHAPVHSLVSADNDCLVGPIFPHMASKNTPTIYTDTFSNFAKPYITYFTFEWENAEPCL